MGDTTIDPVDRRRTSQPLAGLSLVGVAVVSFVVCLASFAVRQIDVGVTAASVTLLAAGPALAWLAMEARRVRQVEREWDSAHHGVAH